MFEFAAMTAADLDAVLAIEQSVQAFPWTAGNFRDALAAGYDCRVARQNGQLVAFAVLMHAVDEVQLLVIGVAPGWQRQGLGQQMLAQSMAAARQAGAARMLLEVRLSNRGAIGFYRQTGFTEIGRRRAYYPATEGREDALVMARKL